MPLLDHFHPPLSERRHWESFHSAWAGCLADRLNHGLLPPGYVAEEQIHAGPRIEIDVATQTGSSATNGAGDARASTAVASAAWAPPAATLVMPAVFPDSVTVEIWDTDGGLRLVAAIELVSPGNKDRETKRRLFAAKCATYLSRGMGLIVVDIVTNRLANLHNELVHLLTLGPAFEMGAERPLYAVAYRPVRRDQSELIEAWPTPLGIGQALPTLPLYLEAERCVPIDLEVAYADACRRRLIDEVAV